MLQNVLSALAEHDENDGDSINPDDECPRLVQCFMTNPEEPMPENQPIVVEWWWGIQLIHILIPKLTPFQIHSTANESMVFSGGSKAHYTVCLLLCAKALEQCPTSSSSAAPLKRWKRWNSVICETIRNFQSCFPVGNPMLWANHMVPACLHAIAQLPIHNNSNETDNHHVAVLLLSAMIGTTTHQATYLPIQQQPNDPIPKELSTTLTSILNSSVTLAMVDTYDEVWVWRHPWRVYEQELQENHRDDDEDENDDDDESSSAAQHHQHQDPTWWATKANCNDNDAGMDTSWMDLGLSVLAFANLDQRPQILSLVEIWKIWFPHITTVLRCDPDDGPLELVEALLDVVPPRTISSFHRRRTNHQSSKRPDSPLETFQLLSNRILGPPQTNMVSMEETQKIRQRSDRIIRLMKALLNRYIPVQQIEIVQQLMMDCPHPGLQAKFLDFLRPFVLSSEPENETAELSFWEYIASFIEALPRDYLKQQGDKAATALVQVDDLIDNVEIHVGAITMVQLFVLAKHRLPLAIERVEASMRSFHQVLETTIQTWTKHSSGLTFSDHLYRINLLEASLQNVLRLLDGGKGTPKI
eukprot:scaffold1869_cov122-Cylindrotheca_fusiformis.AAC.45